MPLLAQAQESVTVSGPTLIHQLVDKMQSEHIGMAIFFGSMVMIAAIIATAVTVSTVTKRRVEAALKRDMLDRGMSVEEIVEVVRAAPSAGLNKSRSQHEDNHHAFS